MAKDANKDQVRGATKVGGEAASPEGPLGTQGGVGGRRSTGGWGRTPDLAQLPLKVAHQLAIQPGSRSWVLSLNLSGPLCSSLEEEKAKCTHRIWHSEFLGAPEV